MLRWVLGDNRAERKRHVEIRRIAETARVSDNMRQCRLRGLGYVVRWAERKLILKYSMGLGSGWKNTNYEMEGCGGESKLDVHLGEW